MSNIGYACMGLGIRGSQFKSCIAKNATKEKLEDVIRHNLTCLDTLMDYNVENRIKLFRISSDLIPFGSSPVNDLNWWETFQDEFLYIGKKATDSQIRLSMHPGQYTVLNSPRQEVVDRGIQDLIYHNKVLDALGMGMEHKIILHIGGIYGDKKMAIQRFEENFTKLPREVQSRMLIENDDKCYHIQEVLLIGERLGIPVVFDNLHHKINPPQDIALEEDWVKEASRTWKKEDGRQKIHYSQQNQDKRQGSHSETIQLKTFLEFYDKINGIENFLMPDIMLEVKDKNLSAVKCQNAVMNGDISFLEKEWSHYKYSVLASSQKIYQDIRTLLKNKKEYPVQEFYQLIENAQSLEPAINTMINALDHVWGYFKNTATKEEKTGYFLRCEKFQNNEISSKTVRKYLYKLAEKYDEKYLIQSYFLSVLE